MRFLFPQLMHRPLIGALFAALLSFSPCIAQDKAPKQFSSKTVTSSTPSRSVDIAVDIKGAKKLFLVVTDGGNGFSCDWADWMEPRLVGASGEKKLTELKWKSAKSQWGQVAVNKNAGGGNLRVDGKPVAFGIGTHANSVIVFEIPQGYHTFRAKGGLDNGGTDQGGGASCSVQFHVFTDKLPKQVARLMQNAGGSNNASRDPEDAIANLDVAEGLQATLFAAEPMLLSPTNIDIDAKGRIWVCEVVNYRRRNGTRKEGDRILILEDTNGDGVADKQKVYYQGRDIDSAMGICVLGNKVIVSCSPNIYVFTDDDGDDRPDRKELLFTKTGNAQHDHSAHAFLFGPDGRLYWNFGNEGHSVHDKNGKLVVDKMGNAITDRGNPYRQGMVFRCDLNGRGMETLGWNFRNNYEVTADSFGTLWQSDNDDDGNRGVRINYVMEYGNYGYTDERTGAGWRSPRTGMSADIPLRHWHLNDPGVVPNLLQTGAGSPTGICVYEGTLLPEIFHNQVIHCDAGPSVVRAYPAVKDGAGYKAEMVDILQGARDNWFRPSDVCVAPDGSIFVADWYDPGVGGHAMGDIDRGRIFRVAPPNTPYKIPTYDYKTPEGAVKALQNPALSVRYLAWTALNSMQEKAEPALLKLFNSDAAPHLRARALWVLGQIKGKGQQYVQKALADKNADIRILGVRMARQLGLDVVPVIRQVIRDASPQVRRECAIALHEINAPEVPELWAELAMQHDGKDRWYLEALGIAARKRWDACLSAWLDKVGEKWNSPAGKDIIWRSRGEKTPELLAKIITMPSVGTEQLPRYYRALDFQDGKGKEEALVQLAFSAVKGDEKRQSYVIAEALARLQGFDVQRNPKYKAALNKVLEQSQGTPQFVNLVARFNLEDRYPELLKIAQKNPTSQLGVDAISALLARQQMPLISKQLRDKDIEVAIATAEVLGSSQDNKAVGPLLRILSDEKADLSLRRQVVRSLGKIRRGALALVDLAKANNLDPKLKDSAAATLHQALWRDVKGNAEQLFPLPAAKDNRKLPSIPELLARSGNAEHGLKIFQTTGTCANCHMIGNAGKDVGPALTEIGDKLSAQAMYEAILFPSAAISHNYESYLVVLNNGTTSTGLLVSDTPEQVSIKASDGLVRKFNKSDIDEMAKQSISLMPADLMKLMSDQDLVDVVAYMTTLKKSKEGKKSSRLKTPSDLAFVLFQDKAVKDAVVLKVPQKPKGKLQSDLPDSTTQKLNVVYAQYGQRKMQMDIFAPKNARKLPAILVVHGGGWLKGDRVRFRPMAMALAARGYVTAAIEYRLGGEAKFPAAIHDCNAAVRYLRAHAEKYGIDPNRIGAVGGSAGGHLVGLMATAPDIASLQGDGGNSGVSSAIQSAIVLAGPLELATGPVAERSRKYPEKSNSNQWLGKTVDEAPELYKLASPFTHIGKNTPPILFMAGEFDNPERNEASREKLRKHGITTGIVIVERGKHGCWNQEPWFSPMVAEMDVFFRKTLR